MAQTQNLLIGSLRPAVLQGLYSAPLSPPWSCTVVQDLNPFLETAQRFPFHGFILDAALLNNQPPWNLFYDVKVRHPRAFFCLLMQETLEDRVDRWHHGQGGWYPVFGPPPPGLAAFLRQVPVISYEHESAAPGKTPAAWAPGAKVQKARSLTDITNALGRNASCLVVIHVAGPDNPLAFMLREITQRHPAAKILVHMDMNPAEAARAALRAQTWCALPPSENLGFFLEQLHTLDAPARGGAPAKETVLVVDDEPHILEFMVDMLAEQGYDVDGVPTGTEAVAALKKKPYQVALVDLQLGDMTGIELLHEFRKTDEDIQMILVTAYASLDNAVRALQAGFFDFLVKPVDTAYLKRAIKMALGKRRDELAIKILNADLQKANHEMNRLNDLKTKFLSIVTHDLRTPLTSIKGYAQVLIMQQNLAEEQKKHFLEVIAKESDRLAALVNDLVDFVSIEAGKLRVEKEEVDMAAILTQTRDRMAPLAQQQGVAFSLQSQTAAWPKVRADPQRLDQVLTNLISNALKHTPSGGRVDVTAEAREHTLRVEVADTGEGIPPADLRRVFEQFFQVEAHASKRAGLGLGLTIAKEIVQAHGGDIGAHSDGPGRGAKFWFTLPLK